MGFVEAIQSGFQNYVNFSDRSSRPAYWWWFAFAVVISVVAGIVDNALGTTGPLVSGIRTIGVVGAIASLVLLLPGLAVLVRRLHDTDRSGWWILITLIPIIGVIVLLVFLLTPGTLGPNRFGGVPLNA